ncbi:hypothetical protein E2320_008654, partial [Naja naja]
HFQSLRISFSPNLDDYNPDIPEWRRDIGHVIKTVLVEATIISSEHILVAILPGLPTSAELFILPYKNTNGESKETAEDLQQISEILVQKLNQNAIQFDLKPGVRILVHAAHLTAAPLIDVTPSHSGSAMLMLLSVVFVGLAVFVIYKFKRKIPGINVYAQMQNEKDQEMVSPGSQSESIPNVPQRELMNPQQLVDEKVARFPKTNSCSQEAIGRKISWTSWTPTSERDQTAKDCPGSRTRQCIDSCPADKHTGGQMSEECSSGAGALGC